MHNIHTYEVYVSVLVRGEDPGKVYEHIDHCMCMPWDNSVGHNGIEIVCAEIDSVVEVEDE